MVEEHKLTELDESVPIQERAQEAIENVVVEQEEIETPQQESVAMPVDEVASSEGHTPNEGTLPSFAKQQSVLDLVEVQKQLSEVINELQLLQRAFDTKARDDQSQQRIIDTLHKELQTYKEGLHFRLLRPMFDDLISLHTDVDRLLDHGTGDSPLDEGQMSKNLRSFQESIEEILSRNGVASYLEDGDTFVAQRQRVVKLIETDQPDLRGIIAKRIRKGFAYENRILRPEGVAVYKFVDPQLTEEQ